MCYSFKTSILSYTLAIISVVYAFYTRQPVLGMLILFYSQMQLSEAFIWKGIDDNNIGLNKFGTSLGKYSLPTHNIAIGIGIIIYIVLYKKEKLNIKDCIPLLTGILFYLYVVLFWYNIQNNPITKPSNPFCKDKSCQNNDNRLVWPYRQEWYIISFFISIILSFIYIKPFKSAMFINSVFLITFMLSFYISKKGSSSVWCFSAAILAPLLVFVNSRIIL